ncbi:hypothetical protein L484_022386 [Morus notabilis]|uniref:Uncharacterized protein n=1 Tax=Morus notabilis TaxID=981085 RepID=W9RF90_9ROSA|nr:hypothetical protein L484_022386 [Morus notabilis]
MLSHRPSVIASPPPWLPSPRKTTVLGPLPSPLQAPSIIAYNHCRPNLSPLHHSFSQPSQTPSTAGCCSFRAMPFMIWMGGEI